MNHEKNEKRQEARGKRQEEKDDGDEIPRYEAGGGGGNVDTQSSRVE